MKNRKNKLGSFVALGRPLLSSLAFTSLCSSAKIAYAYFLYDKKNADDSNYNQQFYECEAFCIFMCCMLMQIYTLDI